MNIQKLTDTEVLSIDEKVLNVMVAKDANKLTKWKQEPSLNDLKHDLTSAQSNQSAFLSKLAYWEKLYDAPKFGTKEHKGSRVNPKLVRKQAEWTIPALTEPFLSTEDLFDVKPLTHDDVNRARQNALILNRQFTVDLGKTKLVNKIVRQLVKKGTCIVRVGWDYQEKEVTENVEHFEYTELVPSNLPPELKAQLEQAGQLPPNDYDTFAQQYQEIDALRQQEPDSYKQLPSEIVAGFEMSMEQGKIFKAKSIGFKPVKSKKQVSNKPKVEICNLKNVFIDPTCKEEFSEASFVIHSYETSLSNLKQDTRFKNLDKVETELMGNTYAPSGFNFKDKARRKVTVYEYWGYWDIDGTGIVKPIVANWVGNTVIRLAENPFPDGKLPYVVFNYLPEEDSIYGIPNAELLGDNQEILGAVTRGMIDLMGKSANSQTGFAKNMLDTTNKSKYSKGMDYEFNQGFNPQAHIFTHKYPEIPNSAMLMVQMMNNEAESLSGVKAFSGTGISASNLGDVAVGVRGVLDAVSKREMSILRGISDGFIQLGRKILSMNSEFLSEEEVVRITNSEFVTIRRDDLAGEYDLSLSISTAEGDDAKAKELAFMLQTMGSTMGQPVMQMLLAEIARLRKMPDLAQAIEQHQPEPSEFEQQMQQLELEYKKAEIELMKAEAMERQAKAQVQEAKVGTEEAKAQNLQSDADNKALDFVERDSGLKHERDLQKQSDKLNTDLLKEQVKQEGQMLNGLSQNIANDFLTTERSIQDQYQQQGLSQ